MLFSFGQSTLRCEGCCVKSVSGAFRGEGRWHQQGECTLTLRGTAMCEGRREETTS